jgi:CheY-like chemotaxis protein
LASAWQHALFMPDQAVILLAEDREDDILIIKRAFAMAKIVNPIQVVRDGEQAIAYLKGEGLYTNRLEYPLPDLLLLDLKMPRVDGLEVLRWCRQQAQLSTMRIVVLTSSTEMNDVNLAYGLGANSFMLKPNDFEHAIDMAKIVTHYWLQLSEAPSTCREPKNPSNRSDRNC